MDVYADPASLRRWVAKIFGACGVQEDAAQETAMLLVEADMRGIGTHGVARVPSYVLKLQAKEVNPDPQLEWKRILPTALRLHADGALGQVAGLRTLERLLPEAEQNGIALALVENCGHLGALGLYALRAARAGKFALVMQSTPPSMAPPGARHAAIGNNPLAFACPVPGEEPIVFDMACSVAARGNVILAAREGRDIPEGWAIDAEGLPTRDPNAALRGAMLPVGGHKGIGIAMMGEILAGILTGTSGAAATLNDGASAASTGGSAHVGAFFMVLDTGRLAGDTATFEWHMAEWLQHYRALAAPAQRVPGERAAALERAALSRGVELSPVVLRELEGISRRLGVAVPETAV